MGEWGDGGRSGTPSVRELSRLKDVVVSSVKYQVCCYKRFLRYVGGRLALEAGESSVSGGGAGAPPGVLLLARGRLGGGGIKLETRVLNPVSRPGRMVQVLSWHCR